MIIARDDQGDRRQGCPSWQNRGTVLVMTHARMPAFVDAGLLAAAERARAV